MADNLPESAFVSVDEIIASPMRPLYLIRRRLQDDGRWVMLASALVNNHSDKLLNLLALDPPGLVDVTDPDVIAMVRAVGGDPDVILA